MTYHRICNNNITTAGATSGAETEYPSGTPEFTSVIFITFPDGVRGVHVVTLHVLSSCCVRYDFRVKNYVRFVLKPIHFVGDSCLIYVISIYLRILVSNAISLSYDARVVKQ
jgi:hypothetical protein